MEFSVVFVPHSMAIMEFRLEPQVLVTLYVPPGVQCSAGDWIGFQCASCFQADVTIVSRQQIWKIPHGLIQGKWACVHLFAGAFNGWGRSFSWLEDQGIFEHQRSLSVDVDPGVTETWRVQGCTMITQESDQTSFTSKWCGFEGQVDDPSWVPWLRGDEDIWLTMSPPCQSWSYGGKGAGLRSRNGLAFLEGIAAIRKLRPCVVTAECSDAITRPSPTLSNCEAGHVGLWLQHDLVRTD